MTTQRRNRGSRPSPSSPDARSPKRGPASARSEDEGTIGFRPSAQQGPPEGQGNTPAGGRLSERSRVHLVLGPVGAGKSTFALKLASEQRAVRLTLDEWMTALFRDDRPDTGVMAWYVERAARCVAQICRVASEVLGAGRDVILEVGLLQRRERQQFYRRIAELDCALTIYVLDAAREVRRERVEQRNQTQGATFSMVVPPAIFELASDSWEPPDAAECEGRDVRFLWTDHH